MLAAWASRIRSSWTLAAAATARLAAWPAKAWVAAAALALTVNLVAGRLLKLRCRDETWAGGFEYRNHCYSDAEALYEARGLDAGRLPYIEAFNEYPVVTGWYQWTIAALTPDKDAYLHLNAAVLAVLAAVVLVTLVRWRGGRPALLWWALAPAVGLYAFYNWDLVAVTAATLALAAYHRDRTTLAGAWLAVGAAAKIYPAVLVPVLAADILRRERGIGPRGLRFAAAVVGTWLVLNLPTFIASPSGWAASYTYHIDRVPNLESFWHALRDLATRAGLPGPAMFVVDTMQPFWSWGLLAAGTAWVVWAVWRARLPWLEACLAEVLVFLLASTVYSLQFTLWVVPFLVVLAVPGRLGVAVLAADMAVFLAVMRLLGETGDASYPWVAAAVLARTAALAALFVWAIARRPLHVFKADPGSPQPSSPQNQTTTSPGPSSNNAALRSPSRGPSNGPAR